MKATLIIFFLALFSLSSALKIASQTKFNEKFKSAITTSQNCVQDAPAEGCVWLYETYVSKREVCQNTPDLNTLSFDKKTVAVQVGPNTKVSIFSTTNYQGDTRSWTASGFYQITDFLCSTSSVQVVSTRAPVKLTISGYVKNGLSGTVISSSDLTSQNIQISFVDATGTVFQATVNSATGIYSVQLPAGSYQRKALLTGYISISNSITIAAASDQTNNDNTILLAPVLNGWRAIVSWSVEFDLDSYVFIPNGEIVKYNNKTSKNQQVSLDLDNKKGSAGPETTTFKLDNTLPGTYKYYINVFKNTINIAQSNAAVVLYHGSAQVAEVNVPKSTSATQPYWWHVFDIVIDAKGQNYNLINKIGNSNTEV